MTFRTGWTVAAVLLLARVGEAQVQPYGPAPYEPRVPGPDAREAGPYQARPPQAPSIQRREAPAEVGAPFTLTLEEQRQVDWVLQQWEIQGRAVKTFECKVWRFEYDRVFGGEGAGGQPRPTHRDEGRIWYAAPDKGRFEIYGERAEKWICDGKAVYEYKYQPKDEKKVVQYDLPPELQGKAIADGPLPFLFGSTAGDLRNRYWIRLTPPPEGVTGQAWLEAFPKFQKDRANFKKAEMILTLGEIRPIALLTVLPNDNKISYRFDELKVNAKNLLPDWIGGNDPFRASIPNGWQKVVERPPAVQGQAVPRPEAPLRR